MRIWKKALSAALTATLLASLAATSAFAALPSYTTTGYLACAAAASTSTCTQVADGISTVTLAGAQNLDATHSLFITVSGATPISAAGNFSLTGSTVTALTGKTLGAADTITMRSPAAPGTATVTVYTIDSTNGIASLDGALTVTFSASSGLDVSATKSVVTTRVDCSLTSGAFTGTKVSSGASLPSNVQVADLCVMVKNGNSAPVVGAVVTATITPVGGLQGDFFGQTTTLTTDANGVADISIWSTGIAGNAVIATSATFNSKTTAFTPVTFGFTGSVASLKLMPIQTAIALGDDVNGVWFTAKDAAGNLISTAGSTVVVKTLTGVGLENPVDGTLWTDWDGAETSPAADGTRFVGGSGSHDIVCPATATSATIAVKNGSVVSNAITIYCSDVASSFTLAFDKATVIPGGTATISATVKDANGFPVPDGTGVSLIVGSGATLATGAGTMSGVMTWTYLAPFNTGVASAIASVAGVTGTQSASITIGAVVLPPAVTAGTNASALGITKTGPFTTATKVAALGKYETFKMSLGAAAAGKSVSILVASKNSAGVWSSFATLTSRTADASGNVYFYWRSSSAAWLSVRGSFNGMTNAVQGRWR